MFLVVAQARKAENGGQTLAIHCADIHLIFKLNLQNNSSFGFVITIIDGIFLSKDIIFRDNGFQVDEKCLDVILMVVS